VVVTQNNWSIYFTGKIEMFLAILSRIRRRILLGGSGDGNEWIYVDVTSRVEVACMSECASES